MKKLATIIGITVLSMFLFAGASWATPIYTGETVADWGTGDTGLPNDPQGPGYYIWSNDDARTSWSVRWTGRDWTQQDDWAKYEWKGSISFSNNDGLTDPFEVLWDSNDGEIELFDLGGHDLIMLQEAYAGPGWDGFDFTLQGVSGDYLTFDLFSSFFTSENDGVYIGGSMNSVLDYSDTPELFRSGTGTNRQFEIKAPVPEPSTILLLGFGLLGLVGFKMKKNKK